MRPIPPVSPWHFGLNEGPIVVMIENYRSGLVWQLMRRCPYVVTGLRRAGFTNGWLSEGTSRALERSGTRPRSSDE